MAYKRLQRVRIELQKRGLCALSLAKGHRRSVSPSPVQVTEFRNPRVLLRLAYPPCRGPVPAAETLTSRTVRLNALRDVDFRRGGRIGTPHRERDDDANEDQGHADGTGDVMLHQLVLTAVKILRTN